MRRQVTKSRIFLTCLLAALTGCTPTQPFFLHEDGDLSHYLHKATSAESPDLNAPPLPEVENSLVPFTLSNPEPKEMWDLTLQEVVSISLANSKVLRGGSAPARLFNGQITAGVQEGQLVGAPRSSASIYNPAITESNPGVNLGTVSNPAPTADAGLAQVRSGPEAALAEFDAQLRIVGTGPNQSLLSSTDRPQNIPDNVPNVGFIRNIQTKTGGVNIELVKQTVEGTQFALRSSNSRDSGFTRGSQFQALKSFWTATMEAEVRHPLFRGRGAQINRMPVVIGRIGTDIEIMGVNSQLQDMLNNIEVRYWDLYLAYRNLETAKLGRDGALVLWRVQYDRLGVGGATGQEEAEAREQYFNFKGQIEQALRNLYDAENELRFLMGLSPSDGRLIRPIDEPTMARVQFDWTDCVVEAICRRPELISKRWEVKQRELELIWARNFLLPQVDVGGLYRWVGLGDDLINAERNGIRFPNEGSSAYDNLTGGEFQEFSVFMSMSMNVGFRRELAGVRHAQLRLAREKAFLEDMELDVSTGLAKAWRNIDTNYQLVQTNANRMMAARRDLEGRERVRQQGIATAVATVREVLDAQRRLTLAENAFWLSVAEYNKSIADFHTRKGSIMEYNGIQFEEGPWPEKAYWDALARARERDAGHYINYGWTRPAVISRGEIPQGAPVYEGMPGEVMSEGDLEQVPTPAPMPKAPPKLEGTAPMPTEPEAKPEMKEAEPTGGRAPLFIETSSANPLRRTPRPAGAIGTGVEQAADGAVRQAGYSQPVRQ